MLDQAKLEVALPMPLSHKWVAYACRKAGLERPRWTALTSTWTTLARRPDGSSEEISIVFAENRQRIVVTSRTSRPLEEHEAPMVRRFITEVITILQLALRQRTSN